MRGSRRSRFVCGPYDWTTTHNLRQWLPREISIGGQLIAASGAEASYEVRADQIIDLRIPLEESEFALLRQMCQYARRSSEIITWYPNAIELASHDAYLFFPRAGEQLGPGTPDPEYPLVAEYAIALRKADGTPWEVPYFEAA